MAVDLTSAWRVLIDGEFVGMIDGVRWYDARRNAAEKYGVETHRIHVALEYGERDAARKALR